MSRAAAAQRLKPLRCKDCRARFRGKPNARFCAACALRRRRASRAAWKRQKYRSDRPFRARANAYSSLWHRAKVAWFWPVPCVDCAAPVIKLRGRTKRNARCLSCRLEGPRRRPYVFPKPYPYGKRRQKPSPPIGQFNAGLLAFALREDTTGFAPGYAPLGGYKRRPGPPRIYIRENPRANPLGLLVVACWLHEEQEDIANRVHGVDGRSA